MITHLKYLVFLLFSLPFLPVLYLQAKKVKRLVPKLREAFINIKSSIGTSTKIIRMITIGESTIAGVGVKDHMDGITGHVAKTLAAMTDKKIEWEVIAKSGYSVKKNADFLIPQLPDVSVDIILIGVGANDTFEFNNTMTWRKNLTLLIKNIRNKHIACPIVFMHIPPVGQFISFPKVMRIILGNLTTLHGLALESIVSKCPNVYFLNKRIRLEDWAKECGTNVALKDFFCDGVHPSTLAYSQWGKEVGEFIVERKII